MCRCLKNMICLFMAVCICFAFAACKKEDAGAEAQGQAGQKTEPVETSSVLAESETTEPTQTQPVMTAEEFFGKAAFIGDSVTLKLRNYNTKNGVLGDTTFLCQGSYSVGHAVNNTMMLSYQGNDVSPQDALKACGADRVFILLGMNDIALYGIDKTIENWGTLIANIRAECPDIEIYIQSGTPIYSGGQKGSLTNANMDKYNVRLKQFAKENGCYYVNVNTPFKDASGGLAEKYCSDAYVHFTDAACQLWVDILMQLV